MSAPARFQFRALPPTHGELLQTVLTMLRLDPRVAWAQKFNTGAHVVAGKNARGRRTRRFIRYAFPGCSDILGQLVNGKLLAIEIKVKRDTLSDQQRAFLGSVTAANGVAFVVRHPQDVAHHLSTAFDRSQP